MITLDNPSKPFEAGSVVDAAELSELRHTPSERRNRPRRKSVRLMSKSENLCD